MSPPVSIADGRYRLADVLGAGGMATVYRAYDERLQVYRAVKLLSRNLQQHPVIQERFQTEARTMARLHHPNIVSVHDIGTDGDRSFIVMELVDGGSLMDYLAENGAMPSMMAVNATLALLSALQVAHDNGVIHRDIKPQNVLVTPSGKPKVTDFGIAHVVDESGRKSLTKTGSVMGTWGFMAPEQRVSARKVDGRSDIYAVGATLYTLLTNKMPVDLFAADLDDELLEGIDEDLKVIIAKATKYKPDDRYADVAEMEQVLKDLRNTLPELTDEMPKLGVIRKKRAPVISNTGTMVPDLEPNYVAEHTPPKSALPLAGATMSVDVFSEADVEAGAPSPPTPMGEQAIVPSDGTLHDMSPPGVNTKADTSWDEPKTDRRPSALAGVALLVLMAGFGWWMTQEPDGGEREAETVVDVDPDPEPEALDPEPVVPKTDPQPDPQEPEPDPEPEVNPVPKVVTPPQPVPRPQPDPGPDPDPVVAELDPDPDPDLVPDPDPEPPMNGAVRVTGDAQSVRLVAGDASYKPGPVPPGTYQIMAAFADGNPHRVGTTVTVPEGGSVTINCVAAFQNCNVK